MSGWFFSYVSGMKETAGRVSVNRLFVHRKIRRGLGGDGVDVEDAGEKLLAAKLACPASGPKKCCVVT